MKKKKFFLLIVYLICFIASFSIQTVYANNIEVYLGGIPAGFELNNRGVIVVGLTDVLTVDGVVSPSKQAGVEIDDIIISIDTYEVNTSLDLEKRIVNSEAKQVCIDRKGEIIFLSIKPALSVDGKYKLGLFIRNTINGIGTITFISDARFASLGHPIFLGENNIAKIIGGRLFNCNITGYNAGENGVAGELKGTFLRNNPIGFIDKNINVGVFGYINKSFNLKKIKKIKIGEGKIGEASIFTTIDGDTPKEYSISIVKTDFRAGNIKNFVIKINDKELIQKTGGIIQGMSGSPIVQNGKLVGAVTHVFTNDPTRGFGIAIENMIDN